jgi:uncharacterized protein (UPF0147 family)
MAQNTNVGDQTPTGAGENTNSPVSPGNGQPIAGTPQGSQDVLELKKTVDLLSKELKGLQSRQDKGQNEVQSFMTEVKQQMASGKSLEEAEAAVNASREAQAKDDLILKMARKLGVLDDVSQDPAGNGGTVTESAAQVISELKLDANSVDVISILGKGYNAEKQELELRRLAMRPNQPQPSAAEGASLQTPAAPAAGVKDLQSAYEKKRDEIAQTLRGDAKVKALSDLKVDYRGRGLNI